MTSPAMEKCAQSQVVKVFVVRVHARHADDGRDERGVTDVVHDVYHRVQHVDAEGPSVEENDPTQDLLHGLKHEQRERLQDQARHRRRTVVMRPVHRSHGLGRQARRKTVLFLSVFLAARASFARPVLVHLRRDLLDGSIAKDIRPVRFALNLRRTSAASCPATIELPPTWKKSSSRPTVRASTRSVSAHASATARCVGVSGPRRRCSPSALSTARATPARRAFRPVRAGWRPPR